MDDFEYSVEISDRDWKSFFAECEECSLLPPSLAGLDVPFLPLQQSDMCLVCIAFASWVLKTANPQVGDAWKAVLLANVSALSAIRYLRKYVKAESAASEKKSHLKALTDF
ncbi:PGC-1 and ERR-induced regulator in muscle protein 1 isoform X2 [Austrofundulus limnaeus]|uniref:PGC-1 and ERR-induced regulator in muscle protein 1 isoform X2 n=1 Tax=Austrofundulus limnaeus TaxID=52670 RepID=A0A2I4BTX8_AUSLI|nr:PREDICTED: PGC-1 and ERR-induced regulator in muscle protein 1 isoform X2 [Austrofundulus limnaeus]